MAEPSLSEVHADLVGRLKHDERLRAVEQQTVKLQAIVDEIPRMEQRLVTAIENARPKNIHAWASVVIALLGVVVAIVTLTSR